MGNQQCWILRKNIFSAGRDLEWRPGGFRPYMDILFRCGAFWRGPGSWGGHEKIKFACNVETWVKKHAKK